MSLPVLDVANSSGTTSGTSLTWSHTVTNAQSNLILLVGVLVFSNFTITGVTYAGASMTQLDTVKDSNNISLYLFYKVGPATGANNIIATASSTTTIQGVAASYYNVAQSSTFGTPVHNTGSGTSTTDTVTTTSTNQKVVEVAQGGTTLTATASQTIEANDTTSNDLIFEDITATGSNMTLTNSLASSDKWGDISVAMNGVGGGGGATHIRISDGLGGCFS